MTCNRCTQVCYILEFYTSATCVRPLSEYRRRKKTFNGEKTIRLNLVRARVYRYIIICLLHENQWKNMITVFWVNIRTDRDKRSFVTVARIQLTSNSRMIAHTHTQTYVYTHTHIYAHTDNRPLTSFHVRTHGNWPKVYIIVYYCYIIYIGF